MGEIAKVQNAVQTQIGQKMLNGGGIGFKADNLCRPKRSCDKQRMVSDICSYIRKNCAVWTGASDDLSFFLLIEPPRAMVFLNGVARFRDVEIDRLSPDHTAHSHPRKRSANLCRLWTTHIALRCAIHCLNAFRHTSSPAFRSSTPD